MKTTTTIGIDLAKTVFQIHGVDDYGKAVMRKRLDRSKMLEFFVNLPPCLIGMEACGSAHYWARKLTKEPVGNFVFAQTRQQRCWVHKMANVLNYLPKSLQPKAKSGLQAIWMADTRAQATSAFAAFLNTFEAKYPKAAACLAKDRQALLAFYDFPAEHWVDLRHDSSPHATCQRCVLKNVAACNAVQAGDLRRAVVPALEGIHLAGRGDPGSEVRRWSA